MAHDSCTLDDDGAAVNFAILEFVFFEEIELFLNRHDCAADDGFE